MSERQHVWVGPDAEEYEAHCDACLARRGGWGDTYGWSLSVDAARIEGRLRREADIGFTTCPRGHRVVVHRVARELARSWGPPAAA